MNPPEKKLEKTHLFAVAQKLLSFQIWDQLEIKECNFTYDSQIHGFESFIPVFIEF